MGLRQLLAPLFLAGAALAAWPRCTKVGYDRYMTAKDDPVTGRNGIGPRGFYIFHRDWEKDGDPCLFLDIMEPGFAKEHPVEHNFFMYIIQFDVNAGIDRDGWLGDAPHMRDTKAVLKRIGPIPRPKDFTVEGEMGPQNHPEREAERKAAAEKEASEGKEKEKTHSELKKRKEATS